MQRIIKWIYSLWLIVKYAPLERQSRKNPLLMAELLQACVDNWIISSNRSCNIALLFNKHPEYVNLSFYRLGIRDTSAKWLFYKRETTFTIFCPNIGEGISLSHPFATIINAEKIGKNLTIRNNTTIGNKGWGNSPRPVIGDNVKIGPNVCIIGGVHIGNNVIIGAGAVVVKDIPSNSVVAGNPAKVIKSLTSQY